MGNIKNRKVPVLARLTLTNDTSRKEVPERSAVPLTQATQVDSKRLYLMTSHDATVSHNQKSM